MLHEFLTENTQEILARTRAKVSARTTPTPTEAALKNGVPLFLAQLIAELRAATQDKQPLADGATRHGGELLEMGFTVGQVVHGYGDVCQVVTRLAAERDAPITIGEFNMLNRCLDDAIASAVTEYERRRDESVAYQGAERLVVLAHEMRNRISVAMLALDSLQTGTVGVGGSTVSILSRSLRALRDLVNNSLVGVRLESGLGEPRRVSISEIVGEMEVEAFLEASAGGFKLTVPPPPGGIDVEVDPQILSAAIANLLQNAFKFSRKYGHVVLRVSATTDHVTIEVEDECGGLPPGMAESLSRPLKSDDLEAARPQPRGGPPSTRGSPPSNRTGLGLGLSISRRGVESMGGTISLRDLPGKGCVFAIELPRLADSQR